jgi:hypothetical protein
MRAYLIKEQAQSIYRDAANKLKAVSEKKGRIEGALRGHQAELERMFEKFAKTQIVQNISSQTEVVQSFLERAHEQALSAQAKLAILMTDIAKLNEERQKVLAQIAHEEEVAHAALLAHPDYPILAKNLEAAELRLNTASTDSQKLLAEVTAKLASYDAHPVFVYLRSAKFGTHEYQASFLSRIGDRIIAKRYAFAEMEKSFLTLQRLEGSAKNNLAFANEEVETCSRVVKALSTTISNVPSYRASTAALGRIESELALCLSEENQVKATLSQHESYSTPGHNHALSIVSRNLVGMSAESLAKLSGATESKADDEALDQIVLLRALVIEVQEELENVRKEQTQATLEMQRAQNLTEMLNKSRYSSRDYRYDNQSSIEGLLLGYLVGSMSADTLIGELDTQCRYMPESTPSIDFGSNDSTIFQTTDSIDDSSYRTTDSF